jgi:hypothetical protein
MISFEVDPSRAASLLDGFSDETLLNIRNAIDAILAGRNQSDEGPITGQPCDSSQSQASSA